MIRRLASLALPVALALALACNAILDNQPADLVVTSEAGTEPPEGADDASAPARAPVADASSEAPAPAPDRDAGADTADARAPCSPAQRLCNGACVDIADPRYGCGSPACQPCALAHATATCAGGACAVASCDDGFGDCDARAATGCETDLSKAATCGACGAPCPAIAPLCMPSGASFACTNGCPVTAPVRCGLDCVDPLSSVAHCGSCERRCADVANAAVACVLGVCTTTCKAGFHACAGTCVPSTDVTACGPACAPCAAGPHAKPACVADACTFTCDPGFGDCDHLPANGCEAALATDPANCGACGTACPLGQLCAAGACVVPVADAGR